MITKNLNTLNYKILKNNILAKFNEYKIEEVENEVKIYRNSNNCDLEGILFEIKLDILNRKLHDAEIKLKNIYTKYEYNFEVNVLLGEVYYKNKNYYEAMRQFIICDVLDISKHYQVEEMYNDILNNYIDENQESILLEDVKNKFLNSDRAYVINYDGMYNIGKEIKVLEKKYFIGLYDYFYVERDKLFKDINP